MVPLWTGDTDEPKVRTDRSYFAEAHVDDTFPGQGAVERQWIPGGRRKLEAQGRGATRMGGYDDPGPRWNP
jgi:hypothetical protein